MGSRRIVVTDLDGTLLGDDAALARFRAWLAPRREAYRLVYASGRHDHSVRALLAEGVPAPDAVISGVGTEIHDPDGRAWPGWPHRFPAWDGGRVREILGRLDRLVPQDAAFQTPLKVSYDVAALTRSERATVERLLAEDGLRASLVYSAGLHLDVVPADAGKGRAARFLADAWATPPDRVLAFGDSGNDAELLSSGFRGTIVANALPELRSIVDASVYRSPEAFADGVLDGIRHWTELDEAA